VFRRLVVKGLRVSFLVLYGAMTPACHAVAGERRRATNVRMQRWHRSAMSGILVDADRPQLGITDTDRCTSSSVLPQGTFSASGASFSLGESVLTRFRTAPRGEWAAPRPADHHLQAHLTRALVLANGEWQRLETAWCALLAETGVLLHKQGTEVGADGVPAWHADTLRLAVGSCCGWHFSFRAKFGFYAFTQQYVSTLPESESQHEPASSCDLHRLHRWLRRCPRRTVA
jgi:hypothetical protein